VTDSKIFTPVTMLRMEQIPYFAEALLQRTNFWFPHFSGATYTTLKKKI